MSKKKQKNSTIVQTEKQAEPIVSTVNDIPNEVSFFDKILKGYTPYVIIFISSIILYANTFRHEFALDDDIVICKNEYVLEGFKGIPAIFSKDLFASFYNQMNTTSQLSGGRYRPLSVASFAIEQEFIGKMELPDSITNIENEDSKRIATNQFLSKYLQTNWDVNKNGVGEPAEDLNGDGNYNDKDTRVKGFTLRHINNVLFYALAVSVLFLFLSTVVFKRNKLLAFIIALLFLAHPIHTEVVADVKSRDEIFSFLFMILTLFFAHQIENKSKLKYIALSCVSFLCALLSKEYGATLIFLVPLSLYLFSDKKVEVSKYLGLYMGLAIMFFIYLGMRSQAGPLFEKSDLQETEILNSPYLWATASQQLATKIFIFLKYLGLLIFPITLSSDYGYNSIPYKSFTDWQVWLSLFILIGMVVAGIISLKKRSWMAFALAFYGLTIMLVTNIVFNVGATMGERLVFHASLGFCMFLGYGIYFISQKMNKPIVAILITLPIILLYSFKTIDRNKAWKNDVSLALTDVKIQPNSVSLNGNAASRSIDLSEMAINKPNEKQLLRQSIDYGKKALSMHDSFVNGLMNLGLAYAKLNEFDSAKIQWDKAFAIYPHHPNKEVYYNLLSDTYYQKGYAFGAQQNWNEGKKYLLKAVEVNPYNARYWYDLGGFSFNAKDYVTAKNAWTKAYQLNPTDTNIIKVQGLLR